MTETATVAGAALIVMLLVMWATRPPPTCAMAPEPHRHLDLERGVDREHLATDVREAARIARRYAAHIAATQADGGSPPTTLAFNDVAEQCQASLSRQLMDAHDVTLEQVRAATSRER
jgi:hypothetical protein